ncbi:MAG: rhodanese-like domain-containing protein [Microthrixaceae bacterium]|nr:rhodanese-like domain-containing protein [Microthrixaceae bacterium]
MIPEIDIDELEARMGAGAALIDVREVDEYEEAHVPGARLLPLSELDRRIGDLSSDEVLLLICKSGARSMRAAEVLAGHGIDVTNVAGGTMAWMASGRDIATGMERG